MNYRFPTQDQSLPRGGRRIVETKYISLAYNALSTVATKMTLWFDRTLYRFDCQTLRTDRWNEMPQTLDKAEGIDKWLDPTKLPTVYLPAFDKFHHLPYIARCQPQVA
jgi:hypothetical protein